MAKCVEPKKRLVKMMKGVRTKNILFRNTRTQRSKPERFDTSAIVNSFLIRVFSNTKSPNYEAHKQQAISDIEAVVSDGKKIVPAFWKKMQGMKHINGENITMFMDNNGENLSGLEIIQRGIAAQHIFSSVKSEHDLSSKYGLSEADINKLQIKGELIQSISALGNLATIGKEIAYTQDISYAPKRNAGNWADAQWEVEKQYARIGLKAIESLEKSGIIDIDHDGQIINRKFKNKNDKELHKKSNNIIKGMSIRLNIEKMVPDFKNLSQDEKDLISKYLKRELSGKEKMGVEDDYKVLAANLNAATWIHRLKTPSNLLLPPFDYADLSKENKKLEPVSKNKHDVKVHPKTEEILNAKSAGTLFVSDELNNMFDFITDYMEKNNTSFEDAAKNLDPLGYKALMGFSEEMDSTAATRDSDRGRSLSKTTPVADFFDNYSHFKRLPFHIQEEIKRNGRGHYMYTVLNPQTDKFFSRYVISIEEYSFNAFTDGKTSDVFEYMVKAVADQAGSGITQNAIMNHGVDSDLDYLLASYENAMTDGKSMFTFMSRAFANSPVNMSGSPWAKMDTLKGILSIRNAVEDASEGGNSKLVGRFMPKPDGTASGAVIMALQMAGKTKENAPLWKALGLDSDNVKDGLRDAYQITEDVLVDLIARDDVLTEDALSNTVRFFFKETSIYNTLRDISKDPSMTVMYNQTVNRAAETLAEVFTDRTYRRFHETKDKKEKELIKNKIYEWMKKENPDIASRYEDKNADFFMSNENSQEVYGIIKSFLEKEVGKPLATLVDNEFASKYLKEHRDFTDEIFNELTILSKGKYNRVTMAPPATVVAETIIYNDELHGEGKWSFEPGKWDKIPDDKLKELNVGSKGIPMMKLFEIVDDPAKDNTVMKREVLHGINGKVNTIHAIDFAILNEAFRRTFETYKSGNYGDMPLTESDIIKYGTVSVHDAISANPQFAMIYDKHYREAAKDVNMMFDINKHLALSLHHLTDGTNTKANDILSRANKAEDAKIKALGEELVWDTKKIFGFDSNMEAQPNIKNGRGNRKTLSIKAKKESEAQQKEMDSKEMLTSRISKEEASEAFSAVETLVESGDDYFAMDTETTNRDQDGNSHKTVAPSDALSITVTKMNGTKIVIDDNGNPITRTFYFQGKPTEGATEVHGLSNTPKKGRKTINQLVKDQEGGSKFKSNEDVWNAFSDYVGGTPMTAYNANFDMDSLAATKKSATNRTGGFDFNSDVYDMYGATVHKLAEIGIDVNKDNTMKDVYRKLDLNKSHQWDENKAHSSEYDVERMVDIINAVYSNKKTPSGSGRTYGAAKTKKKENSKVKKTDRYDLLSEEEANFSNPRGVPLAKNANNAKINSLESEVASLSGRIEFFEGEFSDNAVMEEAIKLSETNPIIYDFLSKKHEPDNESPIVYPGKPVEKFWFYSPGMHAVFFDNDTDKMNKLNGMNLTREEAWTHEIVHFYTIPYLLNHRDKKTNEMKYLDATIKSMLKRKDKLIDALGKDSDAAARLEYIFDEDHNAEQMMAELIAIMTAEPKVSAEIYSAVDKIYNKTISAKFKRTIQDIYKSIEQWMGQITDKQINDAMEGNIDINLIENAISGIVNEGFETVGDKDFIANSKKISEQDHIKKYGATSERRGNKSDEQSRRDALKDALNYTKSDTVYDSNDVVTKFIVDNNDWVADLLWNHLGPEAQTIAEEGAEKVDEWLTDNSEQYVKVKNLLIKTWDNDAMQQIKSWLVPGMIKNRKDQQEFQSIAQEARQKANKLTSTELTKLDNKLSGMTKSEIADLNTIFARAPIFMLIKNGTLLDDIASGEISIKDAIKEIESSSNFNEDIEIAREMADMYIDGIVNSASAIYNLESSKPPPSRRAAIEQLTALYSLQKVKNADKTIQKTKQGKGDLFKSLVDISVSLEKLTIDSYINTDTEMNFRGNFTQEYYKEPISLKAITVAELDALDSSGSEDYSVVLTAKENHGYPVVAFNQVSSFQQGLGTDLSYGSTDAIMPKGFNPKYGQNKGIVRSGNSKNPKYTVVIPHEKKQKLGLIENPAHTLVRSFAHIQEIVETQSIRDKIIDDENLRKSISSLESGYQNEIVDMIKDDKQDEPWFIDLGDEVNYRDLPKEIKHRYKKINRKTTRVSSVGGFDSKISLVRRDIAPWMLGYKRGEPFKGIPILDKASRIVVQAIALMKIHQIIVNPAKVTLDAISTTTLLLSNGVPALFVARGWKRNIPLVADYTHLRAQQVEYTVGAIAGDKTAKSKLKEVEDKLRNHELAGEMKAGVHQSLSTDIILRDYDTITGLQANIEKILEKATNKDDGSLNSFGEAVIAFAKAGSSMGLNIETVFAKMANLTESTGEFEQMAEELRIMGERIAKMKNNDEAAKYLAEYFASPDSNLTRLGSIATTYPDMMSRILYRQYLISKWHSEIERTLKEELSSKKITLAEYGAEINRAKMITRESDMTKKEIVKLNAMVSDFMPDYLYAPPEIVDTLGRFYVVPFVSFTARIQRIIFNVGKRNPLTLIGTILLAESLGVNGENTPYHVAGSNIFGMNMANNPFDDLLDLNTILPTNVLNFDVLRF